MDGEVEVGCWEGRCIGGDGGKEEEEGGGGCGEVHYERWRRC